MSQFILDDTTINVINAAEAQIAGLKADNKANNQAANDQKIGAYCELIASLAPVKLVKGNLPRAVSQGTARCAARRGWAERGHRQTLCREQRRRDPHVRTVGHGQRHT
jgi:hypothetical protein